MADDSAELPQPPARSRLKRLFTPLKTSSVARDAHSGNSRPSSILASPSVDAQPRGPLHPGHDGAADTSSTNSAKSSLLDHSGEFNQSHHANERVSFPKAVNTHSSDASSQSESKKTSSTNPQGGTSKHDALYMEELAEVDAAIERQLSKKPTESGAESTCAEIMALLLKEATIDSPTFRASMNHLAVVTDDAITWLETFVKKSAALSKEINIVRTRINDIISDFMPTFILQGLLPEDYMSLVFGRYAQGISVVWSSILTENKKNNDRIQGECIKVIDILKLHVSEFRKFKKLQEDYDSARASYYALASKSRRDSALKKTTEDTHKTYLAASHNIVLTISRAQAFTTVGLLDALSFPFQPRSHSIMTLNEELVEIGVDMHRLNTLSHNLRTTIPRLDADLTKISRKMKQQYSLSANASGWHSPFVSTESTRESVRGSKPSSMASTSDSSETQRVGKRFGWVYVLDQKTWVPLWAYVDKGVFGLLGVSSSGTWVQESSKWTLKSCTIVREHLPRRWVFSISGPDSKVLVQAHSADDLGQWILACRDAGSSDSSSDCSPNAPEPVWADDVVRLPNVGKLTEETLPHNARKIAAKIRARVDELHGSALDGQGILHSSTLCTNSLEMPAPVGFANKPMPTSMSTAASVANWYLMPTDVPSAIAANYWSSAPRFYRNSMVPCSSGKEMLDQGISAPTYPLYYSRRLVQQDGDMRAIIDSSGNRNIASQNLLLLVLRATVRFGEDAPEMPCRCYLTSHDIVCYVNWQGLVAVERYSLDRILQVESLNRIDFDELKLVTQPQSGSPPLTISLKLYIESGHLAARRLRLLVENSRSRNPKNTQQLLESISAMGVKHASLFRNALEPSHHDPESDANEVDEEGDKLNMTLDDSKWLRGVMSRYSKLSESTENGNVRGGEINLGVGLDMSWKLVEDTYPFGPHILFLMMFGDKSPVFANPHWSKSEIGLWYWNNRKLRRDIQRGPLDSGAISGKLTGLPLDLIRLVYGDDSRTSLQVVEHIEENEIYSVTERRPLWEFPRGNVFQLRFKYYLYATDHGSHLQVWGTIVRQRSQSRSSRVADHLVRDFAKNDARNTLQRTREAAEKLDKTYTVEDAVEKFGKVRAAAMAPRRSLHTRGIGAKGPKSAEQHDLRIAQPLSVRKLMIYFLMKPLQFTFNLIHLLLFDLGGYLTSLSLPRMSIVVALGLSVIFNVVLLSRSSLAYWTAHWQNQSAQQRVDVLGLLAENHVLTKRAIYSRDITDAIRANAFFNASSLPEGACTKHFRQLALLTDDVAEFDIRRNELEPRAERLVRTVDGIRTKTALRRTELLVQLRLLNAAENEALHRAYAEWVANEVEMCSKVHYQIYQLQPEVFDTIRDYCISCLNVAAEIL